MSVLRSKVGYIWREPQKVLMSGSALGWEPSLHANSTGGPLGPSGSLSHLFPCANCVHSSPARPSSALWMKEHSPIQAFLMLVTLTRRTGHARSCSVKPRAASEVVGSLDLGFGWQGLWRDGDVGVVGSRKRAGLL